MLTASEKSSAEDAAATAPQSIDTSNVEDQFEPKNETIAGTSDDKSGAAGNESATAAPEYPKSWKLFVIVAALCLAVFLVALDQTIVAVAVPRITDHFHSLDDVGWYDLPQTPPPGPIANVIRYGSAYLLTRAALQPSFGRIYAQFDVRQSYQIILNMC